MVFNILFDNIFTDLRVRQIIQESLDKLKRATLTLQNQVLPETVNKNELAQAQIEGCQKEVRRLENAMWNERSRIVHLVIDGDTGHVQSGSPQQQNVYEPPNPPPVSPVDLLDPTETTSDEPPPPYTPREPPRR